MVKKLCLTALALLVLPLGLAQAGVAVGVGVGVPVRHYHHRPYHRPAYGVYLGVPAVYAPPPRIIVQTVPTPVYVQLAPVYVQPAPGYAQPVPIQPTTPSVITPLPY